MKRYGHYREGDGYPLAAWVWGHRLRIGQHWLEYMLEFLNVLAGFEYALAEGITHGSDSEPNKEKYEKFTRLGLRRFVFYDEREKTRHPLDERARALIFERLQNEAVILNGEGDPLKLVGSLLRSFSCLEEKRSWYAKSLFPAHHELLFFEALRKGATQRKGRAVEEGISPHELDDNVVFDARNFFARGGEVYYLILSAGTQGHLEQRDLIATRLNKLLSESNPTLGKVAKIVDETWTQLVDKGTEGAAREQNGSLGWIPDPDCTFYIVVAEDVATFLDADLEPLEQLDLLAYLIAFHLTLYLYHRAHPKTTSAMHQSGKCLETCRLALLVDVLEGADGGVVKQASASLFREQEARITQKARAYVAQCTALWEQEADNASQLAEVLESNAGAHFNMSKDKRSRLQQRLNPELQKLNQGNIAIEDYLAHFVESLNDIFISDFRKNFLGVHRKLSKAVGFVSPRKGPSARFTLSDNLLKVLTLANQTENMTYTDFLARLYSRYGLVIGGTEAHESGLYERLNINLEYYDRNRETLLTRMKHAGLAQEYSDATAMITPTSVGPA